jgi:2-polyprenyl-3-methyl-5-hydroxy-6-metoxy-1,4-benzoquinol methylase
MPGLVSQHIAPHSKSLLGVDISQAMVNQFQKKAEKGSGNMRAAVVELRGVEGELDGAKFDVIIVSHLFFPFSPKSQNKTTLTYFSK